ncbi:MAG: hypothetical protein Tsb0020_06280 [Haliangiales bacterium]
MSRTEQRNQRLRARATAQIHTISQAIDDAKRDGSRSPAELAEAEQALAQLQAMLARLERDAAVENDASPSDDAAKEPSDGAAINPRLQ